MPAADSLISRLAKIPGMTSISYSVNTARNNVILGDNAQTIWGRPYISDSIGDISFRISPLSFYQVNPVQTEKLYATALAFADPGPEDVIWDLYCGIGTISLFMAKKAARVCGVEIIPQAIDNARENASLNSIDNAEFFVGKAEEVLPAAYKGKNIHADIIVVDPPRKGCDQALLDCIITMQPRKVVYVSCDPATLARDLRILEDGGFKVEKVQCADMFPHSVHVESVCLLTKKLK
jgi:23S rRNA (uracil1939-C5)-methyltransferase